MDIIMAICYYFEHFNETVGYHEFVISFNGKFDFGETGKGGSEGNPHIFHGVIFVCDMIKKQ